MIDTKVRIATPEGVAFDLHPSGLPARLAAYAIDVLVQLGFFLIGIFIAAIFQITGQWFGFLLLFAINWFYMVIFEVSMSGRSIGKRALGLQVVMNDGSAVQVGASIVRNLLRVLDPILFVGIFVPLLSKGFRRVGDMAASTMVIYNPQKFIRKPNADAFSGVEARPSERLADEETVQALIDLAQRRHGLGRARRRELAEMALPLLMINPDRLTSAPHNSDADPVERYVVSVAAWHAGSQTGKSGNK